MTDEPILGDFVLLNKAGATDVGLIHRIEGGEAYVWWRERGKDKLDGRPVVMDQRHKLSELKVARLSDIPQSMHLLRVDNFPGKTFRTRN
jgi:hypothetical protein